MEMVVKVLRRLYLSECEEIAVHEAPIPFSLSLSLLPRDDWLCSRSAGSFPDMISLRRNARWIIRQECISMADLMEEYIVMKWKALRVPASPGRAGLSV